MKLFEIIKNVWRYNIFDDFLENGAVRIAEFPQTALWQEKAQTFHLDNLAIHYGVRRGVWVAGEDESVVIANWKKKNPTRLFIRDISQNPDIQNHPKKLHRSWSEHNQPFLYGNLKVGFGYEGNRYILQHPKYQIAEQAIADNPLDAE